MKQARLINNIIGGSYEMDERIAGCALSENLFAETAEDASKGVYYTTALRSVYGEKSFLKLCDKSGAPNKSRYPDANNQGFRGMFTASNGRIYAAYGDYIYFLYNNYFKKICKNENIGRVYFCETGGVNSHICWVDGSENVCAVSIKDFLEPTIYSFIAPYRQYRTADQVKYDTEEHIKPKSICCINGCLIIDDPATDTWYYTDPYILGGTSYTRQIYELDTNGNVQYESNNSYKVKTKEVDIQRTDPSNGTSYLFLDRYSKPKFQTAEYSADKITAISIVGDFLVAYGSQSMQLYTQATSTDAQGFSSIVFTSSGRNYKNVGCDVHNTIVEIGGNSVFLGINTSGNKSVYYTNGGAAQRISNNAIDLQINATDTSQAYAFGYSLNGHTFYCLTIPEADKTYCFDFATSQWHNRTTHDGAGHIGAWWVKFAVSLNGEIFIAGSLPYLATLDRFKYDDVKGNPIIKRRTAPVILNDYSPFIVNDLMLLWNTGTTTDVADEQGAKDPVVMLEVSRDGGNTYEQERWAYGGRTGQYAHRSIWYGIGLGTYFVFRFTISDRVNVVITGAKISHTQLGRF